MHKEAREELRLRFKILVLELATHFGPTKTCRDFEVPSSTFYEWKKVFKRNLYIINTHPAYRWRGWE
ncbi:unnamed protein product [marine sediment metagenome]|uniref:Helix-turn-helix domain-containing protein n=1 Tax=marine sediment metagenome TaxID=412755 RepID=X1T0B4_9ZZZZ